MNILTFDIEEWFHLLDHSTTSSHEKWGNFEVRIHENMDRIFRILDDTNTEATFFIIGWIAQTYPELVKRISERYEVGSHTMYHQLVWQQTPDQFRQEIDKSVKLLQDITGKKVKYFRAPGFSIRESESWAFDILSDLGIELDCSIFPSYHAHGGFPSYGSGVPKVIKYGDRMMKELPICSKTIRNKQLIFSGGGYFRIFPYWMIKKFTQESPNYLLSYIHPRDLDPGQPVVKGLPLKRRFKSYVGIDTAEQKLRQWLTDFDFVDIKTADEMIDWNNAPRIDLSNFLRI